MNETSTEKILIDLTLELRRLTNAIVLCRKRGIFDPLLAVGALEMVEETRQIVMILER